MSRFCEGIGDLFRRRGQFSRFIKIKIVFNLKNLIECPFEGWFHSKGEKSQCKRETNDLFNKISDEEKEQRKSMNTLKKLENDEMELQKVNYSKNNAKKNRKEIV